MEVYNSLMSDIRAGRRRAPLVHFRPFADYCLNCLFVAYPASEDELDKQKLPNDLVRAAKQILEHWNVPVSSTDFKKLEDAYHGLSQAVHGTGKALGVFERTGADLLPSIEYLARMMLEWVQEADRKLNGHRGRRLVE